MLINKKQIILECMYCGEKLHFIPGKSWVYASKKITRALFKEFTERRDHGENKIYRGY
ncbi:MAG: hypothetical protein ACTSRR_10790 [Candidatus Heimdallarchaeaceae archaeon]